MPLIPQAVLCAASHQGTDHAAAACMAALGQHASSPAILRAAERAWDGEQPHMSAGQVKVRVWQLLVGGSGWVDAVAVRLSTALGCRL